MVSTSRSSDQYQVDSSFQANTTRSTIMATDLVEASPRSTMCAPLPEPGLLVLMLMHMHMLLDLTLIMAHTILDSLRGKQVRLLLQKI